MNAWPDGTDIEESTLQLGEELGRGGQGVVLRVAGTHGAPLVFKRYTMAGADPGALRTLVGLPATLQPAERERLLRTTSWPLACVMKNGQLSGFLMQAIPGRFFGPTSTEVMKERQLQYLLFDRKPLWGHLVDENVAAETRIEVASQFAKLMLVLHMRSLVFGDVSMMNILWAAGDEGSIFLIDCDGIRKLGARPVLPQADTPDWDDPYQSTGGPDLDTDRYKLALVVGRVLCSDPYLRPGQEFSPLPDVPDAITAKVRPLWEQAGRARSIRPDAWHWMMALSGRDEISIPASTGVRQRPSIPATEMEQSEVVRPVIQLPQQP